MSSKWSLILELRHQKSLLASPVRPTFHLPRPSGSSLFDLGDEVDEEWSPDKEGVREYIEGGTGWFFSLGMG
jgi:hypothetical protein